MKLFFKPKVSLLGLLVFSVGFPVGLQSAQEDYDVKSALQELIDSHKVRGAIAMYIEDDKIGLIRLGEISDERRELPHESSTIFEIGSITKVFTALLVQTLVDEDLLDWDGSISQYLSDVDFMNDEVANVTLRELATHRSGLPRLANNFTETKEPGDPMDPYAKYGEHDLVSYLESFNPLGLTKTYAYSNLGFAILGYIVAKSLDMTYPDALNQRVLHPLEMNNTSAKDDVSEDAGLAAGYSNTANMGPWHFNVHAGAGAIRSTGMDMYKFIRANYREANDSIHQALRSIRELQYESNHALGWITESSTHDTTIFLHSGQTGGYASFLAIDPERNRGWVILTTSTESDIITKIGASYYKEASELEPMDLSPYVGVYKLGENQYMTISDNYGKLQIQVTGQQPVVLDRTKDQVFELQSLNLMATFKFGEDGIANTLNWSQPGVAITAERVDDSFGITTREEVSIDAKLLQQYVGQYQLSRTAIANVKHVDERLFVQVSGQPEFRVFPMSPTRFFYKVFDAEIEFEDDDDGSITGLVFHQAGAHRAPRIDKDD